MKTSISKTFATPLVLLILASLALVPAAEARDGARAGGGGGGAASARAGGGGGGVGASASGGNRQVDSNRVDSRANNVRNTSVNNVNVNRNSNVNANRNVNVNVDGHGGCCGGWDNDYHPVATAAAVTATVAVTSAVIGSVVNRPPANCVPVNYGGMVYQQCGSTWYQPQGNQYVVVNPPY